MVAKKKTEEILPVAETAMVKEVKAEEVKAPEVKPVEVVAPPIRAQASSAPTIVNNRVLFKFKMPFEFENQRANIMLA